MSARSRKWLGKTLVPAITAALGWCGAEYIEFLKLKEAFTSHESMHGHDGASSEMREMTIQVTEHAVILDTISEAQAETQASVRQLANAQQADMREVHRALRIPAKRSVARSAAYTGEIE